MELKTGFWASMLGRMGAGAAGAAAKTAPVRNTVGNLAGSAARGAFMMGPKAGATGTMRAVNGLATAGAAVAPIATSALAMRQPQQGMTVTAAYATGAARAAKYAGVDPGLLARARPHLDHLLELGGLGVLAGAPLYHMAASPEFQQKHPHVGEGLDLAGLGILAVPALRGLTGH